MIFKKRGIPFSGAIAIFVVLAIINPMLMGEGVKLHLSIMTEVMLFVYFMIALATERYKGVNDLIERIWYINSNGDTQEGKYALIKSFIEISVHEWGEYWELYEEIVNGKARTGRLKRLFLRIPSGNVSTTQFTWISAYVVYNIVKAKFFPAFDVDIAFMIEIIAFGYFILASNGVSGMKEFMGNIFKSFKGKDNIEQSLNLLESQIRLGARTFGYLKGKFNVQKEEEKKK